ncbi:MAG: class I SAM-dependent methyltransferase [Candidatus Heimdallarchaeota archaeon]|nr:class I SAM-dependent methyltransferase [Candidatus Heimdallarchaeota archaeon]
MDEYYSQKLSANKLKQCYDIAPPRILQYLAAEIEYVLLHIQPNDTILELGCGYGRVLKPLAQKAAMVYGIDTSKETLILAERYLQAFSNVKLLRMNAKSLAFEKEKFDAVIAIQNGVSAFKVDPFILIKESIRVTKSGGKVIFSSYSEKIWQERLDWFVKQSKEGLLGELDFNKTKNGKIVCKDGFSATTFTKNDFQKLISKVKVNAKILEVDNSSIFCIIYVD